MGMWVLEGWKPKTVKDPHGDVLDKIRYDKVGFQDFLVPVA
jgi:hypothetical protein